MAQLDLQLHAWLGAGCSSSHWGFPQGGHLGILLKAALELGTGRTNPCPIPEPCQEANGPDWSLKIASARQPG